MSGAVIAYSDAMAGGSFVASDSSDTVVNPITDPGWITGATIGDINNLFTPQLSSCFGLDDGAGAMTFYRRFARPVTLGMVSFLGLRTEGRVRVTATAFSDTSGLFLASSEAFTSYPPDGFTWHHHLIAPTPLPDCHTVLITVTGEVIGGARKRWTMGRIWASPTYTPPDQIEYDWAPLVISAGTSARSKGQQAYPVARQCVRGLRMRFSHSEISTVIGTASSTDMDPHQLAFVIDKQPVIAFPRTGTANAHLMHRLGVYGISTRDQYEFPHRGGDRYDVEFDFLETL